MLIIGYVDKSPGSLRSRLTDALTSPIDAEDVYTITLYFCGMSMIEFNEIHSSCVCALALETCHANLRLSKNDQI